MVGEPKVTSRELNFWHVTGDASFPCHGARAGKMASDFWNNGLWRRLLRVASQAFRIIVSRIGVPARMRIVAGQATDPRVLRVIATAVSEPIGLKAYGFDSTHLHEPDLKRTAMARAAKVPQVSRIQASWVEDMKSLKITRLDCRDVFAARSMAALTSYAWNSWSSWSFVPVTAAVE